MEEWQYSQIAWIIPLMPLLAFLLLIAFGRQFRMAAFLIATGAAAVSFVLSLLLALERIGGAESYTWNGYQWLELGQLSVRFGYQVTDLNVLMLVVVSTVTLLVMLYSRGYLAGEERLTVYYGYLSLFAFAMLGLVLSENLIQLYIFWELVGLGSFLLIGFYFSKPAARAAAKKAFIVTRIGDIGLLLGIFVLYWNMPNFALDFNSIHNAFATQQMSADVAFWAALFIFIGAIGKSAQFPLHVWLPDAMEGPTPISALIHAATMVAAGVYLVVVTFDVFLAAPAVMTLMLWIGAGTALMAAFIACRQNDIKRILAYSTVSQLGLMFAALGAGAASAAMYHLFTHAFFKALLFLAAGSVIHALHQQNIWSMGGLRKKMPITTTAFFIGGLALAGLFPLSGFWSKEAVLTETIAASIPAFIVLLAVSFLTAYYMTRLFAAAFLGPVTKERPEVRESPQMMTWPLIILIFPAVLAGYVNTPWNPWLHAQLGLGDPHAAIIWWIFMISIVIALLGIYLAYVKYSRISNPQFATNEAPFSGDPESKSVAPGLQKLAADRFYFDELYDLIIVKPHRKLGEILAFIDEYIVSGLVDLVSGTAVRLGYLFTRLQNGQTQTYGLITLVGLVIILLVVVGRRVLEWNISLF